MSESRLSHTGGKDKDQTTHRMVPPSVRKEILIGQANGQREASQNLRDLFIYLFTKTNFCQITTLLFRSKVYIFNRLSSLEWGFAENRKSKAKTNSCLERREELWANDFMKHQYGPSIRDTA